MPTYNLNELETRGLNEEYTTVVYNSGSPKILRTLGTIAGEGGVIVVNCVAVDASGSAMTGAKRTRFSKSQSGVLTLGSVQNDLATQTDADMQGCSFNIVKNTTTQDIEIQVTGIAGKDIRWQIYFDRNSCVLG
jgi:hypothetical protein